jgi:hypothetical protein
MPSADDEEVEEVAADAFTPVKTAVRDLVEECWSPPPRLVEQRVRIGTRLAKIYWRLVGLLSRLRLRT